MSVFLDELFKAHRRSKWYSTVVAEMVLTLFQCLWLPKYPMLSIAAPGRIRRYVSTTIAQYIPSRFPKLHLCSPRILFWFENSKFSGQSQFGSSISSNHINSYTIPQKLLMLSLPTICNNPTHPSNTRTHRSIFKHRAYQLSRICFISNSTPFPLPTFSLVRCPNKLL